MPNEGWQADMHQGIAICAHRGKQVAVAQWVLENAKHRSEAEAEILLAQIFQVAQLVKV